MFIGSKLFEKESIQNAKTKQKGVSFQLFEKESIKNVKTKQKTCDNLSTKNVMGSSDWKRFQ